MSDERTYGERAVGIDYNPSVNGEVATLKRFYATIIDLCDSERAKAPDGEAKRLWSIAITEAQGAQMWAVKAATWRAKAMTQDRADW